MYATFNRFGIELTKKQAKQGGHPGPCDDDIAYLLKDSGIASQLDSIPAASIHAELKEYGAWDDTELNDNAANRARILWIACGNILEDIK